MVGLPIAVKRFPAFASADHARCRKRRLFLVRLSFCSFAILLCTACGEDVGPKPIEMIPTDVGAAWSPDGSMLAVDYRPGDASTAPDGVYIVDLTSGDRRFIAPFAAEPDWSPDGSKLALSGGGTMSIADLSTGEIVPFDLPEFSIDPSWSPDGSTIVSPPSSVSPTHLSSTSWTPMGQIRGESRCRCLVLN